MIGALVLVAVLLVSTPTHSVSCWLVKRAVAQYGEAVVEVSGASKRYF